jgi:uncharacterized protein YndB with AHSA1/START domain
VTESIQVDELLSHPPAAVWRALTEPDLLARWWTTGDIRAEVGHSFLLDMEGWGQVPCTILEAVPPERLVYTFTEDWTLVWQLVAEGTGTRLLLEHRGFDLDVPGQRFAFDRMGPGWRDEVLPALAAALDEVAA